MSIPIVGQLVKPNAWVSIVTVTCMRCQNVLQLIGSQDAQCRCGIIFQLSRLIWDLNDPHKADIIIVHKVPMTGGPEKPQ